MGNFYVNFATRGAANAAVADSLRSAKRKAFVGPTIDGVTVFFDEKSDTQDESEIKDLGEQISKDIDRDKYLTAQGAKEYGLIDDILTSL